MTETRGGREWGTGTFLGDRGEKFFSWWKPLRDRVREMGWSHACPTVDQVIKEYGPEWTLKRYAECNFVFGLVVGAARDLNPSLFSQLTVPIARLKNELPGSHIKPKNIPKSFYKEMSPLSTPWGYAIPRVIIEEMGRGPNNKERTQERILKALNMIDEQVKSSKTPIELLVNLSESASGLDAKPVEVLSHTLAAGVLREEGCETMYDEIKKEIDKSAPILHDAYKSLSVRERVAKEIINFD